MTLIPVPPRVSRRSRRSESAAGRLADLLCSALRDSHVVRGNERPGWAVVVPVKLLAGAKTRLQGYGDAAREQLALSFAADVVETALACPAVRRVLVVTDDARAAGLLRALGAAVVADAPAAGLNRALGHGAALLQQAAPDEGVVAVASDLPALRAAELAVVLAAVPTGRRVFVPDAESSGSTVLAAAPGIGLDPAFGAGSRMRHLQLGALEVPGGAGLRRDVDTPADLAAAVALGVGRHTAAALAMPATSPSSPDGARWCDEHPG